MSKRLDIVEEQFLNTVRNNSLIEKNDRIVVGVSGGPDSITLLHLLLKYQKMFNIEIVVAHINHMIRKDSTKDEEFVEKYCKDNNVSFYVKRAEVEKIAKESKRGTEEVGRDIRYAFFDEVMEKVGANKIAIAHNKNDNAETLLLNLIRGTGTNGMEGIRPQAENKKYIRPLIEVQKKDIVRYAKENKLNPRIDSTNSQNIYRRNVIRNKIIPELEEINPNIVDTLARTSDLMADVNSFLEDEITKIYEILAEKKEGIVIFKVNEFNIQAAFVRQNLVLKAIDELAGNRKNISKTNVDDIVKLAENNVGRKYIKVSKKITAEVKNKKLYLILHSD